ncbi:flagellar FliL protein [Sphingomonas gellani]|uniref:Flagellar protein FliL n=1 Tax=Sphingomonas gellani TaxID=1166340 RepID=A0A1H8CJ09_9SPHN|nr:flagellar basal body-associated FliL family protein [Sphingomonas gellani]SEM94966.1 flagellar FliL protein [Sphingomonas gellani]
MSDKKEDAPKKKGKMGKIIMIAVGALVLAGGGVGAGLYAAKSTGGPAEHGPKLVPKDEQKRASAAAGAEGGGHGGGGESAGSGGGHEPPSGSGGDKYASNYYAMDKDFTANLQNSVHFLQIGVAVSTPYDDSVIGNLKTNDIAVRSAILMALGDTTEDEVFTADGKKQLQRRLVKAINDTLQQKEGFGGISNVYFTSFVVQ